jgi:hypothetical protein
MGRGYGLSLGGVVGAETQWRWGTWLGVPPGSCLSFRDRGRLGAVVARPLCVGPWGVAIVGGGRVALVVARLARLVGVMACAWLGGVHVGLGVVRGQASLVS